MSDQPADDPATDLPDLDPDTFAGEGPAGDAHPDQFGSDDQSARRSGDSDDQSARRSYDSYDSDDSDDSDGSEEDR